MHVRVYMCVCVVSVIHMSLTQLTNRQKTEKETKREGELKREVTLYVGHSRVCRNFYNVEYLFDYFYIIFLFYL